MKLCLSVMCIFGCYMYWNDEFTPITLCFCRLDSRRSTCTSGLCDCTCGGGSGSNCLLLVLP